MFGTRPSEARTRNAQPDLSGIGARAPVCSPLAQRLRNEAAAAMTWKAGDIVLFGQKMERKQSTRWSQRCSTT